MEQTNYSKLSQRDVDRAETDLLINLSTLTQRGLAKMIGCHESKISRTDWRFIASVLCAFGMASDISPISRAFKYALDEITNKKRPEPPRVSWRMFCLLTQAARSLFPMEA
ncbi:TPA: CII family transcriptional regulator [Escherichia coli]